MPRKAPTPRAERVFAPPADLLLTEEDLRAWAARLRPLLAAVGFAEPNLDEAAVHTRRAESRTVYGAPSDGSDGPFVPVWTVDSLRQLELRWRLRAPGWVAAETLELRLSADGGCGFHQKTRQSASGRAVYQSLCTRAPRWKVPPQGRLPFAIKLRERNGWEGEAWNYWLPLSSEEDALALADGAPVSTGRDVRVTPFDAASLREFGSWRLEVGYAPEWRADMCCATTRVGYMAFHNWSGHAAGDLADLVATARRRKIVGWRRDTDGPGFAFWKGTAELYGENGKALKRCALA